MTNTSYGREMGDGAEDELGAGDELDAVAGDGPGAGAALRARIGSVAVLVRFGSQPRYGVDSGTMAARVTVLNFVWEMIVNPFYFLTILVGLSVVVQGNLTRQIGDEWGLTNATFFTAVTFLCYSLLLYGIARWLPNSLPEFLRIRQSPTGYQWWYLIPGLCGFCFVLGLPWAFQNLGAAKTFILLVSSQIVFGLLWDLFITQLSVSRTTLIGAALTLVGAVFTVFGK